MAFLLDWSCTLTHAISPSLLSWSGLNASISLLTAQAAFCNIFKYCLIDRGGVSVGGPLMRLPSSGCSVVFV